jgi:predicted nucleic acid-binding protein
LILYLDTSALVKLYVREADSALVQAHAVKARALATSVVAYAESRAAFARLKKSGLTSDVKHQQRLRQLDRDWDALLKVELAPDVLRSAGDLTEIYGLRGFDAIHLASALWLKARVAMPVDFAVFDKRLAAAADKAGLMVVTASL